MNLSLKELKSGTDIRGVAFGNLTVLAVKALAQGFAMFLGGDGLDIAVGHDSRLSASALSDAAVEGLIEIGHNVKFCGLCSTPSMFMMTQLCGCDGAIMLTASHHPSDKNGMKFFCKAGGVTSGQLSEIIANAEKCGENTATGGTSGNVIQNPPLGHAVILSERSESKDPTGRKQPQGTFLQKDFLEDYCAFMRGIFERELGEKTPLKGLKIAVDAGNGAAGFYAERILQPLGADISGSQFLQPDGRFPNHVPNPENKQAIESILNRVKETNSDLGIIFDTDGDRSAIISGGKNAVEVNRNRLIAMISACLLRENKGAYVVTDSVTSEGLKEFIEKKGGVHIRYKRGYQNVIGYAKQLCAEGKNAILAIETSGHAAFLEHYFLDDGAYLAARLIIEAVRLKKQNKTLLSFIEGLKEPLEEKDFRLKIDGADFKQKAENAMERLGETCKNRYKIASDSFEGIRVYTPDGWFMARLSVHDPIIPVNIESGLAGGAKRIASIIFEILKDEKGIDLTTVEEFIKE